MMESLHILKKDVRHLWAELSLYAALLIAFSLVAPHTWPGVSSPRSLLHVFFALLRVLIPITWLVLIVRVVQDEALVGEEQFWITRPYRWVSLLGAKLSFLLLCIVLPFIAMQWSLLLDAGLNPAQSLRGMAISLISFALILWLPMTLVAAVTSTLAAALMTSAGVLALWVGLLTVVSTLAGSRMEPPFVFAIFSITFGVLLIGILLYQFAFRDTMRSRAASVGVLVVFVGLFAGYVKAYFGSPVKALIRMHYPSSSRNSLQLVRNSGPVRLDSEDQDQTVPNGMVQINLPVHVEGLQPTERIHDPNALLDIHAPGLRYESPWRSVTVDASGIAVLVPEVVFARARGIGAHVHLSFVAEKISAGVPRRVVAARVFRAPGDGSCVLSGPTPVCRYGYQSLAQTRVEESIINGPCDSSRQGHRASSTLRVVPAGTTPDPVVQEVIQLGGTVCPGDQLAFTTYPIGDRFRLEFDFPSIDLAQYKAR